MKGLELVYFLQGRQAELRSAQIDMQRSATQEIRRVQGGDAVEMGLVGVLEQRQLQGLEGAVQSKKADLHHAGQGQGLPRCVLRV